MFSFIIFNNSENLFFFARDLFGQKPLYFSKDKNQLIFSSEIKPIMKLKRYNKIIYEESFLNILILIIMGIVILLFLKI